MANEEEAATQLRSPWKRAALKWTKSIVDASTTILILIPLVVGYWRGTWYLLEIYLFPPEKPLEDPPLFHSLVFSLAFGISGGLIFSYTQNWMMKKICRLKSPVLELFCKRAYCYIFGIIPINHWRGLWGLLDVYIGNGPLIGLISFLIGLILLVILRCFRNCISLVAASDLCDDFFIIDTRFRVPRSRPVLFFLDNLFSVAIIGSLCGFFVRGAFALLDYMYYPLEAPIIYLTTWGVGMILFIVCLVLQSPASLVSIRLEKGGHWFLKLIFEDLYVFLYCTSGVHVWHSIWGLCDSFIYSHNPELSSWICHSFGIGGLMLLFHASSVLVKGFQIDGELSNGEGCWLPAQSLTIFDVDIADRKGRNRRLKERITGIKEKDEGDGQAPLEQRLLTRLDDGRVDMTNA